jgi:hypothetical protein
MESRDSASGASRREPLSMTRRILMLMTYCPHTRAFRLSDFVHGVAPVYVMQSPR